jgi:hypothetical protein
MAESSALLCPNYRNFGTAKTRKLQGIAQTGRGDFGAVEAGALYQPGRPFGDLLRSTTNLPPWNCGGSKCLALHLAHDAADDVVPDLLILRTPACRRWVTLITV